MTRVSDTGKRVSPWISPSSRIDCLSRRRPEHELDVIDDAEREHQDADRDQGQAEMARRARPVDDVLLLEPLEELEDREAEADQRQRRADDRHQRSILGETGALERHPGATRRKLGVDVQLEFRARHRPLSPGPNSCSALKRGRK